MANQENKGKCETFILRGNADSVMRQLVDEYNSSNGWSVNRIVNNILNFTVVLERNSEQGVSNKDTSKNNSSDTTKDTTKLNMCKQMVILYVFLQKSLLM